MAIMEFFDPSGETQIDERVVIDEAVTIDGNARFKGYLNYIGNKSIEGNTSATFGAWASAGKAGQRYNILISGPPSAPVDPSNATTLSIDLQNGILYAQSSITVFVRYLGHGPVVRWPSDTEFSLADSQVVTGGALSLTSEEDQYRSWARAWARAGHNSQPPSSNVSVSFSNGTESFTLTIPSNGSASAVTAVAILKCTAAQTLTASIADGLGVVGWRFGLRGL